MSELTRHTQLRKRDITVIKLGGGAIQSERAMNDLAAAVGEGWAEGRGIIMVNGGGKEIDTLCKRLSIETQKVDGLRVTTPEVLEAVQMSLSKKSFEIALSLMGRGIAAVPLPAFAGGMVLCRRRPRLSGGQDLGLVGEITSVDRSIIDALFSRNALPVIYPLSTDDSGVLYNVNADEVASSIASAVGATALLLMTDVPGIVANSNVLKSIRCDEISPLLANGQITEGMMPKVRSASSAALSGVGRVCIMDGSRPDSLSAFFKEGILNGTEIRV
jgi:acetylglutamate kinase